MIYFDILWFDPMSVTHPYVLKLLHRRVGPPDSAEAFEAFPGDEQQLVPDGRHDPQLRAVVCVDGVQMATWWEDRAGGFQTRGDYKMSGKAHCAKMMVMVHL